MEMRIIKLYVKKFRYLHLLSRDLEVEWEHLEKFAFLKFSMKGKWSENIQTSQFSCSKPLHVPQNLHFHVHVESSGAYNLHSSQN